MQYFSKCRKILGPSRNNGEVRSFLFCYSPEIGSFFLMYAPSFYEYSTGHVCEPLLVCEVICNEKKFSTYFPLYISSFNLILPHSRPIQLENITSAQPTLWYSFRSCWPPLVRLAIGVSGYQGVCLSVYLFLSVSACFYLCIRRSVCLIVEVMDLEEFIRTGCSEMLPTLKNCRGNVVLSVTEWCETLSHVSNTSRY